MTGTVTDRIEIKGRGALEYGAEGVVVMIKHDGKVEAPNSGQILILVRNDGWSYSGKAEDVRYEPATNTTGLFLRGLTSEDVPLGSLIRWGENTAVQSAVA